MNIEIRKLTPNLAEDYVHFFDVTPHDENIDESKCYCVCWCSADHRLATDFSSREKRRELAVEYVKSGKIQGYLAYLDDRIVGWCNANTKTECLYCVSWLRFMTPINEMVFDPNDKVKSIYCFTVAPDMKRKGIAKQLLQYACQDAADNGFDYVEAYPEKEIADEGKNFMGPVDMYKNAGFTVHGETERKYVMRKYLK